MTLKSSKSVFLDVDRSIIENNLRIAGAEDEEFNKMFQMKDEQYPSKLVKPFPGLCIKTKEIGTDVKIFVNICHTDSIPPPKDISERELTDILESDEISEFRVPMSIGDLRNDEDKKGDEAKIVDIAINPSFFKKIQESTLFKSFFMTIVFEGLKEKHGVICQDEKIILKNKKCFGNLQVHRIQQREIDEKMGKISNQPLIKEINGNVRKKPLIETISSQDIECRVPEYRLFKRKTHPNCLIGEFIFPDVISAKQLSVDIGEDRIVIESTSKHYLLDIFVPFVIRQAACSSMFDKRNKILTVTMPLIGG